MDELKCGVVFPAYNEAARINLEHYSNFSKQHPDCLIIMVDDGSTDNSRQLLAKLEQETSTIRILLLDQNVGKAEAIRQGFNFAKDYKLSFLGFADSDEATPFSELSRVIGHCKGLNDFFLIASREKEESSQIKRRKIRLIASFFFKFIVTKSTGVKAEDPQCGCKFMSVEIARELFEQPFISRWLFDVELLFRFRKLRKSKARKYEVENIRLKQWTDIPNGKLKLIDFLIAPFSLLAIIWHYKKY